MNIYEKNIKAILKQNVSLATDLIAVNSNEKFEVFLDDNESLNINIINKETFSPMYKTKPLEEIKKRYDELITIKRYPYLYFFGMGNGVLFKMLLQNEQHQRIVVVEPELEILYVVLNLIDFSADIENESIVILYKSEINFSNTVKYFKKKDIVIYNKLYDLYINNNYYDDYSEDIKDTNNIFIDNIKHSVIAAGNDSIDALIGIEHHIMNLPELITTPTLKELKKKIKVANTAVLVSTGPSLNKQLKKLKEIQDNVIIVAVDASFPVLFKNGIKPDVVVSMERVPLTGEFFKQTPKEAHEGVIFALSSIQHPNVVNNIKAGTKHISMRSFGYTHATGPNDWGYIGIGMSAANLAFEHIYYGKVSHCILIGQDLAYAEDGNSHAKGHILGANEVKEKQSDSYVIKYGGEGTIKTTYVWNMFRNYFETDIENSKNEMLTINSTEGGARIHGALEMTFENAIEKYVDKKHKKKKIVLNKPTEKKIKKSQEKVNKNIELMHELVEEKLKEIKDTFLEVAKTCEYLDNAKFEEVDFNRLVKINTKIEIIKDYFLDESFSQTLSDSVYAFIVHQELEIAKIVVRDIENDDDKKKKLIDWIQIHKFWLFSLAGCVEAVKVALDRKGSQYKGVQEGEIYNYDEKRTKLELDMKNFAVNS